MSGSCFCDQTLLLPGKLAGGEIMHKPIANRSNYLLRAENFELETLTAVTKGVPRPYTIKLSPSCFTENRFLFHRFFQTPCPALAFPRRAPIGGRFGEISAGFLTTFLLAQTPSPIPYG